MQQVFLIGDSIRLGYRAQVAEKLKHCAQVFSSDDNARFTTYTLRYLHEWAALVKHPENIAVVHWNNGLWDACHFLGDEEALTPLPTYLYNLTRIFKRIRTLFPNAKIIFALSTAVGQTHERIRNDELDAMNAQAQALLAPQGVIINDLNALVKAHPEYLLPDQTHMTQAGYDALGAAVGQAILHALG